MLHSFETSRLLLKVFLPIKKRFDLNDDIMDLNFKSVKRICHFLCAYVCTKRHVAKRHIPLQIRVHSPEILREL